MPPIDPEDRLILSGRGLSDELDAIIAEENYLERASIKEFLGNMPREQAEEEAREEMYGSTKSREGQARTR